MSIRERRGQKVKFIGIEIPVNIYDRMQKEIESRNKKAVYGNTTMRQFISEAIDSYLEGKEE